MGHRKCMTMQLRHIFPLALLATCLPPVQATAQALPTIDTEDSELGTAPVGTSWLHPSLAIDLRNGDFVRGGYDDDGAGLSRLPAHVQLGLGADLHRGSDGRPDLWLVARSSNGFHAPRPGEASPRGWYESNTNLGLVAALAPGLRGAASYVIKTSPNGVSDTTHEASASFALDRMTGLGALKPTFVATIHARGGKGLYTQFGIGPELDLGGGGNGPSLSFPAHLGFGWNDFYGPASGRVLYGDAGIAYAHPLTIGAVHGELQASAVALFRDRTLRRLGRQSSQEAETGAVLPYASLSLTIAY